MLKDWIGALALLLIAFGYYYLATQINPSALADEIGAAGLPMMYATVLAALGLALAAKSLMKLRRAARESHPVEGAALGEGRRLGRAAGMLAIGISCLLSVTVVGYVLSVAGMIFLVALYQGERLGWRLAGIAVGGAFTFWMLFDRLLGIDMPSGYFSLF